MQHSVSELYLSKCLVMFGVLLLGCHKEVCRVCGFSLETTLYEHESFYSEDHSEG